MVDHCHLGGSHVHGNGRSLATYFMVLAGKNEDEW